MEWHGNLRSFVSSRPETSFNFLYNYNNFDHQFNPGMDVKQAAMGETSHHHHNHHHEGLSIGGMEKMSYGHHHQHDHPMNKKKRLTSDQLDSLERSFQEEIKLDPDRKMKLSRELGLQPRQIAVWFQNRRARWKAKQLERLYDSLKQEFDVVSKEKHNLQQEVQKLKNVLREQTTRKQVSTTGYTEVSGEETVESTSVAIRSSGGGKPRGTSSHIQVGECNYLLNVDEYNPAVSSPNYWAVLPTHYP